MAGGEGLAGAAGTAEQGAYATIETCVRPRGLLDESLAVSATTYQRVQLERGGAGQDRGSLDGQGIQCRREGLQLLPPQRPGGGLYVVDGDAITPVGRGAERSERRRATDVAGRGSVRRPGRGRGCRSRCRQRARAGGGRRDRSCRGVRRERGRASATADAARPTGHDAERAVQPGQRRQFHRVTGTGLADNDRQHVGDRGQCAEELPRRVGGVAVVDEYVVTGQRRDRPEDGGPSAAAHAPDHDRGQVLGDQVGQPGDEAGHVGRTGPGRRVRGTPRAAAVGADWARSPGRGCRWQGGPRPGPAPGAPTRTADRSGSPR